MLKKHLLAVVFFALPSLAFGQNSGINGSVADGTTAVIANASVEITNMDTGVSSKTISNGEGLYSIQALQPGRYKIVTSAPGFSPFERSGVVLSLDTTSRIDIVLKSGNVNASVTVVADADLVQSNGPESENYITSQQFDDLSLVQQDRMRNPAAFIYQTPGVQGNIAVNGSEYVGATNVILVHGGQQFTTELLLEGLPGGQSRWPGNYTESAPSVDSIREFKMTSTQLSAEYGHTGAAVGSFAVKSGANAFHGSAYEYIRNSVLDATNWLAKHTNTVQRLSKKQNEFGATISGPMILPHLYNGRDKTFFFFTYGGSRLAGGAAAFTTVLIPTMAQRQGDFGSTKIYDPSTTTVVNGRYVRKTFPNDKIPASAFDPITKQIVALMPEPNLAGNGNNYGAYTGAIRLVPDTFTAKVDHSISSSQNLSSVFVHTKVPRTTIGSPLPKPLGGNSYQALLSDTFRLVHNWTLSPKLLNSGYFGYNRFVNPNFPLYNDENYIQQLGITGIPDATYFPQISFSNGGYAAIANNANAYNVENGFYFKDRVTWSVNRHMIKAGGEYRIIQFNDHSPYKFYPALSFSSQTTATQSATSSNFSGGNSFASFLLGQVFSGSVNGSAAVYSRRRYTGFFVQDDIRYSEKLTLNVGLRYEWQNSPREANNGQSAIDLNAPNPGARNLPGVLAFASVSRPTFFNTNYSAISPRFGFAYKVKEGTVVRGGYGIYYTETLPNISPNRSGYSVTGTFASSNGADPAFLLKDGVPQTYPTQPTLDPTALNGQNGSYYEPNTGAMPRIQEWTFGVQQAIGKNAVLEANYIGNHGTRLLDPQMANINQLDPKFASLGALLQQSITSADAIAAGIKRPYPTFTGTVAQALRPFPQYLTLSAIGAKRGMNSYNAGVVSYRQRLGFGLMLNASYTWSKNLGYNSPSYDGSGPVDNVLQNAYDPTAERSLLPQDVEHAAVFNYVYGIPFGAGHRFLNRGVGNAVFGGWKLSGVHRYQSGTPLSLLASNQTSSTFFNRVTRPNLVPGVAKRFNGGSFNFDTDRLINPDAFTQPDTFTFGDTAPSYGNLRNFGTFTEDMALVKETQVTEHLHWSFYAQANNTFNRHRFYGIQTNISSTAFGKPSNVSNPRYLQFGTRLRF
jgi:hypothetical protein